jgi:hypothetical protein
VRLLVARPCAMTSSKRDLKHCCFAEEPDDMAWGVDETRGFRFDWWAIGGRWHGWGRKIRKVLKGRMWRLLLEPLSKPSQAHAVSEHPDCFTISGRLRVSNESSRLSNSAIRCVPRADR